MPLVARCDVCGKEHAAQSDYLQDVCLCVDFGEGHDFLHDSEKMGVVCRTYECIRRAFDRLLTGAIEDIDKQIKAETANQKKHAKKRTKLAKRGQGDLRAKLGITHQIDWKNDPDA